MPQLIAFVSQATKDIESLINRHSNNLNHCVRSQLAMVKYLQKRYQDRSSMRVCVDKKMRIHHQEEDPMIESTPHHQQQKKDAVKENSDNGDNTLDSNYNASSTSCYSSLIRSAQKPTNVHAINNNNIDVLESSPDKKVVSFHNSISTTTANMAATDATIPTTHYSANIANSISTGTTMNNNNNANDAVCASSSKNKVKLVESDKIEITSDANDSMQHDNNNSKEEDPPSLPATDIFNIFETEHQLQHQLPLDGDHTTYCKDCASVYDMANECSMHFAAANIRSKQCKDTLERILFYKEKLTEASVLLVAAIEQLGVV